jgi:hypothetical protein
MNKNTADEFSFNGFSGVNIDVYQSDVKIGKIRAIHVKGQEASIVVLDDEEYISPIDLSFRFDLVISCSDEYGNEKRMAIHGITARDEITGGEINTFDLQCVTWWHDSPSKECDCIACNI